VLIPDICSGYAPELARGASDEAARNSYSIILCNTDDLFVHAQFHADRLIEHTVSGVIFVPTAASVEKNRFLIDKFLQRQIPVVLADRCIAGLQIDCVTTDNFQGAYKMTQYLIDKGHQKVAFVASSLFSTEQQRLEGYKAALSDHQIALDPDLIVAKAEPFIEKRFEQEVHDLLLKRENFTAVFAGHDRIAYLLFKASQQMGLSIPEDFSIAGYDDLPFSHSHPVPLTTMHQPIYEMGQESMKLIQSRIRGTIMQSQKIELESRFVERSSVLNINTNVINEPKSMEAT
jgi:LacI family transcriptional regulator